MEDVEQLKLEIRDAQLDLWLHDDDISERRVRQDENLQKEIHDLLKRYDALKLRLRKAVSEEEYEEFMRSDDEELEDPVLEQTDLLGWVEDELGEE